MKKKKYSFGSVNNSSVKNYIESPNDALAQNDIDVAKAMFEGNSNPLYIGLKTLGNLTMTAGGMMGGTGSSEADKIIQMLGNTEFGMGGTVKGQKVEVEGKETIEYPNGKTKKVKGPSHEQGGVDMLLPDGTEVFSDRIKVNGKTMAQRKDKRANKLKKFEDILSVNPGDTASKNSFNRTKLLIEKEEQEDLDIQTMITNMFTPTKKAAYGLDGTTGNKSSILNNLDVLLGKKSNLPTDPNMNLTMSDINEIENFILAPNRDTYLLDKKDDKIVKDANKDLRKYNNKETRQNNIGSMSGDAENNFGDITSIGGDLISTFGPLLNTLKNRATDTPNVNAYKDFGKDGLDVLDQTKGFVKQQQDNALNSLELSSNTARQNNRKSARGINTVRSLDLVTEQQKNRGQNDIYNSFAQQMMNILGQQAGMENQQDQVVMGGEAQKGLANRQDKDNFQTQLGRDISNIGTGLQETGKDINSMKQNDIIMQLLGQLSEYGITIDGTGKLMKSK